MVGKALSCIRHSLETRYPTYEFSPTHPEKIHSISYSRGNGGFCFVICLRPDTDFSTFNRDFLRINHLTLFHWGRGKEPVFSVLILKPTKIQHVVQRLLRANRISRDFGEDVCGNLEKDVPAK